LAVEAGKLKRNVPVITSVHPLQLIRERIDRKRHDFSVDIILIPDEILRCPPDRERPKGIYWKDLSKQKIEEIPALKKLTPQTVR
jgi:5-formyltetrahydrofolate cyclo-ligase